MAVKRIHIDPSWSFHDEAGNRLEPLLFQLLAAILENGKLTVAAAQTGISYRHSWNLLNKWKAFFGTELVKLEKGRGAQLTTLGEKLLWAEQRIIARLQPQMENLASELNMEIHRALADIKPLLRLHASHGYAVALLPEFVEHFQLDLRYKSPTDALAALNRGACDVAGFHVPTEVQIAPLMQTYRRFLKPRTHRIIRFITRQQGLIVKLDNPKDIHGISHLNRPDVRFINRQRDSGTRALLDQLLKDNHIDPDTVTGIVDEEFTHSAVAAYVAAGMADVGFGVEAAARQFGLGFIPITTEHYLMVCHERSLQSAAVVAFLKAIRSAAFIKRVAQLPGYTPVACGKIQSVKSQIFARAL